MTDTMEEILSEARAIYEAKNTDAKTWESLPYKTKTLYVQEAVAERRRKYEFDRDNNPNHVNPYAVSVKTPFWIVHSGEHTELLYPARTPEEGKDK